MTKLNWEVVHECDDALGNPTEWAAVISHPRYGVFCWIDDMGDYFSVSIMGDLEEKELAKCKSLTSAKRWVSTNLI